MVTTLARPTLRDRIRRTLSESDLAIRLAEATDAAPVSRLLGKLTASEKLESSEDLLLLVEGALSKPSDTMFVLRDDGQSAAQAVAVIHVLPALAEGGRQIYIDDLLVSDEARGQGLGGRLMKAIAAIGGAVDSSLIFLHARPNSTDARHLYESAGFLPSDDVVYRLRD